MDFSVFSHFSEGLDSRLGRNPNGLREVYLTREEVVSLGRWGDGDGEAGGAYFR